MVHSGVLQNIDCVDANVSGVFFILTQGIEEGKMFGTASELRD